MYISYQSLRLLLITGGALLILLTSGDFNVFFGYPAGFILIFTGFLAKQTTRKANTSKGLNVREHFTWPVLALVVITLCFLAWLSLSLTS